MNRKEHFFIAVVLLVLSYFFLEYIHLSNYFGYAITILVGSILPDIIEPAKEYTHRGYFHSRKLMKILIYSIPFLLIFGLFINSVLYLLFLVIGYLSHLLLDSKTKMGLPK